MITTEMVKKDTTVKREVPLPAVPQRRVILGSNYAS